MSSMQELIFRATIPTSSTLLGIISFLLLSTYTIKLLKCCKNISCCLCCLKDKVGTCFPGKVGAALVTLFVLVSIIANLFSVILAWPHKYDRTYEGEDWQKSSDTLRLAAVRTGMHIGLLQRVSFDCEDDLSNYEASSVTIENGMKWVALQKGDTLDVTSYEWGGLDQTVERIRKAKQRLRGHALVWDSIPFTVPEALKIAVENSNNKTDTATKAMIDHFNVTMSRYADIVSQWDVVNEPIKGDPPRVSGDYEGPLYEAYGGEEYIDEAFRIARDLANEIRPDTKLFLNEAISNYDLDNNFNIEFFNLLDRLIERNVSIDCVGIQGHQFFNIPPSKAKLGAFVNEITKRGLCFEFTEIDARLRLYEDFEDPYQAHGETLSVFYDICANLPRDVCLGVTAWGVTDITAWYDAFVPFQFNRPNEPFLFDTNAQRKPAWKEAMDILNKLPDYNATLYNLTDLPTESTVDQYSDVSCSNDDEVYRYGRYWYILNLIFCTLLPLLLISWFCCWKRVD